ncbi:MAG: hypothetical protein D4Q77_02740 [Methanothrix sp.]|nr:MAG: hypothetical protein D4Q77_02740 [Methanothrix sp.]
MDVRPKAPQAHYFRIVFPIPAVLPPPPPNLGGFVCRLAPPTTGIITRAEGRDKVDLVEIINIPDLSEIMGKAISLKPILDLI